MMLLYSPGTRHHCLSRLVAWFGRIGRITHVGVFVLVSTFCYPSLAGEPYVPTADNMVLEKLPRSMLTGRDELTSLRRQLVKDPRNEKLAIRVAQQFVSIGNLDGDPRFFGYARSAIRPWWNVESPPSELLKLRAKLKEKDHLYDEALSDLAKLLERDKHDAQAWIELANIHRVKGQYAEAWRACQSLETFAGQVPIALCRAPLLAATGKPEEAYEMLIDVLPTATKEFPSVVQWMYIMQADLARSLGRTELAEQHFRTGLSEGAKSSYLLRSYADYLLDDNQPDEVIELLRDYTQDNGILLRATIAARRVGRTDIAAEWQAQLESRFQEIRLRGGQPHGRYEARYQLEINNSPKLALRIALENWTKQKESRDSRNVLEAAIAANDAAAAQPVIAFLQANSTKDVRLQKLVDELVSKL